MMRKLTLAVSSITWLENNVFLLVHTPSNFDSGEAPSSVFHIATRNPPSSFVFQKVSEPVGPFGLNRSPPHHFFLRLRDFPPNLQDLIIVASTASTDIGLFSRSKVPLASDKPAGVFTMTEMSDDSRRAQLPMTGELNDTSPIGLALDLSSKEKVTKPIPSDEMDESPTPLPALMVLNNEGVLASWWIVYSDSIRQGTIYPGLVAAEGVQQQQSSPAPVQAPASAFGGAPKVAFGAPSIQGPTSTGAFGSTSSLGQRQSPWSTSASSTAAPTSAPAFGAPAFGTPSFGTPSFGSTSTPSAAKPAFGTPAFGTTSTPAFGASGFAGPKQSPWASAASTTTGVAFGQTAGLGKPAGVFGSTAPTAGITIPSSGGFASFASKGGFAAAAPPAGGSIFGSKPASNPFGTPNSSFGMDTNTSFGGTPKVPDEKPANPFGGGSGGFVLGSTFKADPTAKDEASEPSTEPKSSFFGGAFGSALGEAAKAPPADNSESNDADMDSTEDTTKPEEPTKPDSTTPASTPAPAKSSFFSSAQPVSSGLFGSASPTPSSATTKPAASAGFSFGTPATEGPKPGGFSFANLNTAEAKPSSPAAQTPTALSPPSPVKVKEEPVSDGENEKLKDNAPEPPLPPESTSKTSHAAGDTSVSSTETKAPSPPASIPKSAPKSVPSAPSPVSNPFLGKPISANLIPPSDVPGGPEDEGDETDVSAKETKTTPKSVLSPPSPVSKPTLGKPISADLIPPSDVPLGPEDEDNDSDFLTEEDDDENDHSEGSREEESEDHSEEEGSGEDVAKDLSPTSEANQTPGLTPQSSFGAYNNRSPESSVFTKIQKPGQPNQPRSLFGEINISAPVLPPPKLQSSPRSPSPIRSAVPGRMLRPDALRSVSAPGVGSHMLGTQRLPGRSAAPAQSTFQLSLEQRNAEEKRRAEAKANKEAAEKKALVDDEDEEMQKFLASEITGTTILDEFVAHTDYIGPPSVDSIPAQVETVYRDINSMIDTLGINARALKSFIKGHTEQYKEGGRNREDLESDESWCLVEIEDLSTIVEDTLTRELENGRVKDVADKLETCNELQKDLIRLRARLEDIKKIHASFSDPEHLAITRAQPLSAEQAAQQHDLRRDFHKFQNLLSEAEEGLTILKAKIVSQATSNGKSSGTGPTVEAVMRTITKMTSMAEKRSGDIDVLEGEMRKLRFDPAASTGSREGSPFATPQKNRASLRNPATSSTYGLFYTPESVKEAPRGFQSSLMSSTNSLSRSSPPRKKLSGYTPDEKAQIKAKLARKKEVTDRLRTALQKAGTNVRLMDDDDEK